MTKIRAWATLSPVKPLHLTLSAVGLGALALALVAFFAAGDSTRAGKSTAVGGQAISRTPDATPTSTTTSPTPTASVSASPSPAPPPDPYMHIGAQGPDVLAVQQKLTSLTYMTAGTDGKFGGGTRDGLVAFQKVNGLKLTGEMDPPTSAKLASASAAPQAAYATPADHLEVDIAKQVVYVVRGGVVANTLTTSTGSGQRFTSEGVTQRAITPNGVVRVYWKIPGWHHAPLGELYKPSFFNGGIAFHGYYEVPSYPASHGCVRLPMEFADWFYDQAAPPGAMVYVYGGPNGPNPAPAPETSTATNPPPTLSASPTPTGSPTPAPSSPAGCLNALLGMPCPTPTPTPTPTPSPTPTPTPTPATTPTGPPTPTSTATSP